MHRLIAMLLAGCALSASVPATARQSETRASEERAVRDADDAFWRAFNACDKPAMASFFADDVEFYHDMTGLTRSRVAVTNSMMTGPCGTPGLHMRRELVASSVRYQPIPGYGALLSGEHVFYARQGDGAEHAATRARFTVIWKHEGDRWLMTRVISSDHAPVAYQPSLKAIAVPANRLARYQGRYRTEAGIIDITLEHGALVLRSAGLRVSLAASAPGRFFALERDLQFRLSGKAIEVVENGAVVASGPRVGRR